MELSNRETRELFRLLSEKVGDYRDGAGFRKIEDQIPEVTKRFLYDKWRDVETAVDPIRFHIIKIDALLKFLDFEDITSFKRFVSNPISEVLKSCCGTWISLVRQNSRDGFLYQSPVAISQKQHTIQFKLRGPSYIYEGEMIYINGCLTVLFSGASGKQFHHVYKIGNRQSPKVLQGIYSGISTGDDPIGGRCLLYRVDEPFDEILNQQLNTNDLLTSESEFNKAIGIYFQGFERNNLRLNQVIAFDIEDLRSS